MKRYYIFFVILAVVSALAIGSNTLLRRGPVHDAKAVQDIRNLQSAVDSYYLTQSRLPDSLRQLKLDDLDVAKRLSDYEYLVQDTKTYQLCTVFQTKHQVAKDYYQTGPTGLAIADPDSHAAGRQCFTYIVLPIQADPYIPKR